MRYDGAPVLLAIGSQRLGQLGFSIVNTTLS